MSAQVAILESWLLEPLQAKQISLAQAWALQDLLSLILEDQEVSIPPPLIPAFQQVALFHSPVANHLPL